MPICGTGSRTRKPPESAMPQDQPVTAIVDTIETAVADGPVAARDLMAAFGHAALAPTLAVPALLIVSPLSAIPLFSSFCGLAIFLIAIQGAFGRSHPWLPGFLQDRTVAAERISRAVAVLRRLAGWLDWATRQRLSFLVRRPMTQLLYLICAAGAALIPALELVPMSSTTIGAGVLLIAIGILARDGVFAVLGLCFLGLAAILPWLVVSRLAGALG